MLIPSMGYIVGLILGFIVYRKPRNYVQRNVDERETVTELKPYVLIVTIIAILATFIVQTFTDSMILVRLQVCSFSLFLEFISGMN